MTTDVRVICAIGQRGQLGLDGRLPWEGARGRAYTADVERFFDVTRGHVIAAGPVTIGSVPDFVKGDRTWVVLRSSDRPEDVIARYAGRVLYIGGGPAVWDAYAKYVRHWDVTRLPYDGDADRWFKPEWLVAAG
ncbi:MAG TPA: dihydrofolate reductase [Albitalea sp.]